MVTIKSQQNLSNYQKKTHSVDIQWLLDDMLSSNTSTNKKLWDTCVEEALQESDEYRNYLELTK